MKYVRTILNTLAVCLLLWGLAACMSQPEADNAKSAIDTFTDGVAAVVGAIIPGAGAAVKAGGALSKLIISAFVAAPPAAAAVTYKLKGGAFTPSGRRAKREEDQNWDSLLVHAEELAKAAPSVSEAVGGSKHVAAQSANALKVVAALKAAQKKPAKARASVASNGGVDATDFRS